VHDAVEAIVRLLHSEAAAGQAFNVGSDGEISIDELAQRVIARADSPWEIRLIPIARRTTKVLNNLGGANPTRPRCAS
jgi:nucleoside-diphosphate-sugar epimerase